MMHTPAAFDNAPLSLLLLFVTAVGSISASILNVAYQLYLDRASLLKLQVYRLFTSHLFFRSTTGEMFSGLLALYCLRIFERQLGERKFASFVFSSLFISILIQIAVLVLYTSSTLVFAGPYSVIFSLFVLYYDLPAFWRGSLLGFPVSDKVFTYFLGLQLMTSNGLSSAIAAISGILAGILVRSDFVGLGNISFPTSLRTFCYTYIRPLLANSQSSPHGAGVEVVSMLGRRARRTGGGAGGVGGAGMAGIGGGMAPGNPDVAVRNRRRNEDGFPGQQPLPQYAQQQQQQPQPQMQPQPQQQQLHRQQLDDALAALGVGIGGGVPTQDNIDKLMAMGFSREVSVEVLSSTGNDLQQAIQTLIS